MASRTVLALVVLLWTASGTRAVTFTVTTTDDTGGGTLRQAILDANADTDPDMIAFAIGSGAQTITPASALPIVTSPVTIDGTTQPGFAGTPLIEIDGVNVDPGLSGIALVDHTGSTVRGLVINRFSDTSQTGGNGILIAGGGGHTIEGNYLGVDLTGTQNRGNGRYGVACVDSSGSTIGGTTAAARNLISANMSAGILLRGASSNVIQGNWIGVTGSGSVAMGNGTGVFVLSSTQGSTDNTIGGDVPAAANVISANGIGVLVGNSDSSDNVIKGNLIGTDSTGAVALGNTQTGVTVNGAPAVTIDGNVVAASNFAGIDIHNLAADGVVIRNNKIGTDVSGTVAMGNGVGILVSYSTSGAPVGTTIGGSGAGNLIAYSDGAGIAVVSGFANVASVFASPSEVDIQGNAIVSNGGLGIDLEQDGVTTNDTLDMDTGANGLTNFPVVNDVVDMGDDLQFIGTFDAAADTAYRVELFSNAAADGSGNGEGEGPLGTTMVTTDPAGHGVIDVLLPVAVGTGEFVTATATDPAGNTSEFSVAFQVGGVATTSTSSASSTSTSTEEPTTTTSSTSSTSSTTAEETTTTSTTSEPTTTTSSTTVEETTTTSTTSEPSTTTSSTTVESTTSTSTTVEPTTTTSSTTVESTTTTSTTAVPTTSTTTGPSTSTTNPPPASTTTTPSSSTTTTTLLCGMAQPLPGIACRINALATRVGQQTVLAALQTKLQNRLEQAGARVEDAREACLLGKTGTAKRKLGKARKALAQFSKTLRSRKAKTVPAALRDELTGTAAAIGGDVGLVKLGLVCG